MCLRACMHACVLTQYADFVLLAPKCFLTCIFCSGIGVSDRHFLPVTDITCGECQKLSSPCLAQVMPLLPRRILHAPLTSLFASPLSSPSSDLACWQSRCRIMCLLLSAVCLSRLVPPHPQASKHISDAPPAMAQAPCHFLQHSSSSSTNSRQLGNPSRPNLTPNSEPLQTNQQAADPVEIPTPPPSC